MLFSNMGISYNTNRSNSILSSVYTNNVIKTILLPFENSRKSLMISAGISKYMFALKTTASLKVSWQKAQYDQLLNDSIVPSESMRSKMGIGLSAKPFRNLTIVYNGDMSWNHQLLKNSGHAESVFDMKRTDQSLAMTYSMTNGLFGTIQCRSINNTTHDGKSTGYSFIDANLRYKIRKPNADLTFEVSNLTNITTYQLFTLTERQFLSNSFAIRGRMAIIRMTFNL